MGGEPYNQETLDPKGRAPKLGGHLSSGKAASESMPAVDWPHGVTWTEGLASPTRKNQTRCPGPLGLSFGTHFCLRHRVARQMLAEAA